MDDGQEEFLYDQEGSPYGQEESPYDQEESPYDQAQGVLEALGITINLSALISVSCYLVFVSFLCVWFDRWMETRSAVRHRHVTFYAGAQSRDNWWWRWGHPYFFHKAASESNVSTSYAVDIQGHQWDSSSAATTSAGFESEAAQHTSNISTEGEGAEGSTDIDRVSSL